MDLTLLTYIQTGLSIIALLAGIPVAMGLLRMGATKFWTVVFLAATVLTSIKGGRNGAMPAWNGVIAVPDLEALVAFLPYWSDPELPAPVREAGLKAYAGTCAGCHGADGKGNVALGAPNLTDEVWLWGGRGDQVRHSILFGRTNNMPAHAALISEAEARVVAADVLSLSGSPPKDGTASDDAVATR